MQRRVIAADDKDAEASQPLLGEGHEMQVMEAAWPGQPRFETFTALGLLGDQAPVEEDVPFARGVNVNAMKGERAFRIISRINGDQVGINVPNKSTTTVMRIKKAVFEKLKAPIERQELTVMGVPLNDDWSVEDVPENCQTLYLELKPDKSSGPRELMSITHILDEAEAWEQLTDKAAFGSEAELQRLNELRDEVEVHINQSESTRMTWEDPKKPGCSGLDDRQD